ncbi:12869_t:CDS:1, partial [Dentiscutata heterogama]
LLQKNKNHRRAALQNVQSSVFGHEKLPPLKSIANAVKII